MLAVGWWVMEVWGFRERGGWGWYGGPGFRLIWCLGLSFVILVLIFGPKIVVLLGSFSQRFPDSSIKLWYTIWCISSHCVKPVSESYKCVLKCIHFFWVNEICSLKITIRCLMFFMSKKRYDPRCCGLEEHPEIS